MITEKKKKRKKIGRVETAKPKLKNIELSYLELKMNRMFGFICELAIRKV